MIINIRVIPKANRNLVVPDEATQEGIHRKLKIYLTKPAQDGLANKQLIDLLAEYLNIKKYQIKIIKGEKSRDKLVKIDVSAKRS